MFKKGFLAKDASKAKARGPLPALPTELLMKILEEVAIMRGPGFQRDVANLRLANKFLRDVATPYFYRCIEVCGRSHTEELVRQLQAQPKLWPKTRCVWWDEKRLGHDLQETIETSELHLLKFENIDEVGFCARVPTPPNPDIPIAWQHSLRDVGPWCKGVDWIDDYDHVQLLQTTPTLWVKSSASGDDMRAEIRKDMKRKRAIWAVHVVAPSLDDATISIPKTCTHFTITLFEHPMIPEMELAKNFDELIDNRERFPLLQHLHVRLISFGARPNGLPTEEDRPAYLEGKWPTDPKELAAHDQEEWWMRSNQIEQVLLFYKDRRTSFETIVLPGVQSQTRYEDMRKFIRKEWRERVWGRPGPWPKPPTQKPASLPPRRVVVADDW